MGITEEDSEVCLDNAEKIVKNAEMVLEEFFSSQSNSSQNSGKVYNIGTAIKNNWFLS